MMVCSIIGGVPPPLQPRLRGPCLQRLFPRMVMGLGGLVALLEKAFELLGANAHRRVPDRSQPRPKRHVKPHPNMAYKG